MRNLKDWPNWVPWQGAASALIVARLIGTSFVFHLLRGLSLSTAQELCVPAGAAQQT